MTIRDTLTTIPCLSDNYAFLFESGDRRVVVDAPEARPILSELGGRPLTDILLTHHHPDHIDGVREIVAATGARVWGAAADAHRLPPLDRALSPGETAEIGPARAQIWDVSGHTIGHIAFVFDGVAFTGDSLMAGGCGRLFEGTPAQMQTSLSRFADLPDDTLIASGHEYTQSNLAFARSLEPDNADLIFRSTEADRYRADGQPSVPSRLDTERQTNPFLRAHVPAVKAATGTSNQSDTDTFAATRRAKDAFR